MTLLAALRSLVSTPFHQPQVGDELDEELRAHIQDRADDLEHAGILRAEAERQARLEFGGYQKFREECRETLGTHFFDALLQDLRYALHMRRVAAAAAAGIHAGGGGMRGGIACGVRRGEVVAQFADYRAAGTTCAADRAGGRAICSGVRRQLHSGVTSSERGSDGSVAARVVFRALSSGRRSRRTC
jgi:hypothetical protein